MENAAQGRNHLRVIAGRPASNAPIVQREEKKPVDAVEVMNVAALVFWGLFGFAFLFGVAVLVLSLERVTS